MAQQNASIIGVMGWPTSKSATVSVDILAKAHLPMVSPTASSDELTGISPYFFRIAPPDSQQGKIAALYAWEKLHARRIVIFSDPNDAYSRSLARAFQSHFHALCTA